MSPAFSGVKNSCRASTRQAGLICSTRSLATSTLGRPRVDSKAMSCRLILERATVSLSNRSRAPTPLRARASTT